MTVAEAEQLGWNQLDIILVTGDCYIDSPHMGVAVIGKWLVVHGFRVGVIAQPDIESADDITRLGAPLLFWGVTGGSVDSMVANYTALKKRRQFDDYTPGGVNEKRPDRAIMVYANLIRRYFKPSPPIVLGGMEASLRRVAHYDFWTNSVRRSLLFDAKADYILYGMAERSVVGLAERLRDNEPVDDLRGLCRIAKEPPENALHLPSYEESAEDKGTFIEMFRSFYNNNDPITARPMVQKTGDRWLVHNPPSAPLSVSEMDSVYDLDYERSVHPSYEGLGVVTALDTIRFSIATHRGCYGECNFCGITAHQGRTVQWRSQRSIVAEAEQMARRPDFHGYLTLGGAPTGNMYGFECHRKHRTGACADRHCMTPTICEELNVNHSRQTLLLEKIRAVKGVRKVFNTSGMRHDLVLADGDEGDAYLLDMINNSISGQLKIAPEHNSDYVLELMGKPHSRSTVAFANRFYHLVRKTDKRVYLTYYLIAAHPGCDDQDMEELHRFATEKLNILPEQVQVFTPLPSTWSAVMYYTETNPFTGKKIFVEKDPKKKERQKKTVTGG